MSKTFQFLIWSGKKAVAFLVLTVALSLAIVGTTIAYIIDYTESLKNTFTPPVVDIESDAVAGNIIKNGSDVDVYLRAAVVVNWVDEDGAILSTKPVENTDYTLDLGNNWVKGSDGFYYYTLKVAPDSADILVLDAVTCPTVTNGNYTLTVQVISSAIQAAPTDAVVGAWESVSGVNGDGSLIITTP